MVLNSIETVLLPIGDNTMTKIWIADIQALGLKLDELLQALPPEDREKALRYRRAEDQLRCAAGRTMIRALAAEAGMPKAQLMFSAYGKPAFADGKPQFNLSHSGNWVALAAGDAPLGIDVEKRETFDWESVSCFFTERERESIRADREPLRRFYRLWTMKEAFAKEEGRGLSLFEEETIEMDCAQGKIAYQGKLLFLQTWETPEYTLSFCGEEAARAPHRIIAEEWPALG